MAVPPPGAPRRGRGAEGERAGEPRDAAADLALAAACAAGEAAAWERLIERCGPWVTGAVRKVLLASGVRDAALEEELVGDAFAELMADGARALRSFRGESKLGTFLSVIAGRVAGRALERQRAEARARRVLAERQWRASGGATGSDEAAAPAEARERADAVRAALEEIHARDRLLLTLFHTDGRSYKEIAAVFGIAASGVGTELARARARLARKLEARGFAGAADEEDEARPPGDRAARAERVR
jgi:RNA polymerase sigma-70 factor (ECF subfamily)